MTRRAASLDTIAARAGCSRKAVTVAVGELERLHLLRRRQGGGRRTTQYELVAPVKPASRQARRSPHSSDEAGFTRQRENTEIELPSINSDAAQQLTAAGVREPMLGRLTRDFSE
jgi:DNA-binding GntR family transcriptional regulator